MAIPPIRPSLSDVTDKMAGNPLDFGVFRHYNQCRYLVFPETIPEVDKAIYFDADLRVVDYVQKKQEISFLLPDQDALNVLRLLTRTQGGYA